MTETKATERIVVHNAETEYPYLIVPSDQLADVCKAFDAHSLTYWPNKYHISMNNDPYTCNIRFPRGTDGQKLQAILNKNLAAGDTGFADEPHDVSDSQ